jgi:hypothetical protein
MACECGCALQLLAVSEIEFERAARPVPLALAA